MWSIIMKNILSISMLSLLACGDKEELQHHSTCGDPVCGGYSGAIEGVAVCASEVEGAECSEEGAECDLENDCNQRLICAVEDPATECPVSEAKHKRDIVYIDSQRATQIQAKLQQIKIAEWNYNWDSTQRDPRLGFIIDDSPNLPAIHENGRQVDLYGYTSMVVVAIQNQARQIEVLEAKIKKMEEKLADKEASENTE
jgi:hypothetical protein